MLPLLQSAYINLACSKQYWAARAPSPHSKSPPIQAIKHTVVSIFGSPQLISSWSVAVACGVEAARLIYQQFHSKPNFASLVVFCAELQVLVYCQWSGSWEVQPIWGSYGCKIWNIVWAQNHTETRRAAHTSGSAVCVTQCDTIRAQAFSQQGLCSLFALLQIFVTRTKWLSIIAAPAMVW